MKRTTQINCLLTFLLSVTLGLSLSSQSSFNKTKISLDKHLPINAVHPYIDEFTSKNDEYILALHSMNKVSVIDNEDEPTKIVRHSGGNNSLVFTITQGDNVRYDTLRNTLHPDDINTGSGFLGIKKLIAKWRAKSKISKLDIEGNLPKGAMAWQSAKRWGLEFGVQVPGRQAKVKIVITTLKGKVVATIVDDYLSKGWNNYKWKRKKNRRGSYKIHITMDDDTMVQTFKM